MNASTKILKAAAGTSAAGGSITVDDVFSTTLYTGDANANTNQTVVTGLDMAGEGGIVWVKGRSQAHANYLHDSSNGNSNVWKFLSSNSTDDRNDYYEYQTGGVKSFNNNGFTVGNMNGWNQTNTTFASWSFLKSPKFFDIQTWSGTGSARTIPHSLGAGSPPEMIWIKSSSNSSDWSVFHTATGKGKYLALNEAQSAQDDTVRFNNTAPTDANFSVGGINAVNGSGRTYIAYLFTTLANVSKVSSVVHTGTTNVDAGFTNGSRFILLKRTDASGDWYIWDSVRGVVSGSDPYLLLNSTAAEVTNTDYIDPYSAGFTLTSSLTAGTYIYYAIA